MTDGNSIEVENSNLITISGNIISDGGPIESNQVYGLVLKDVYDVTIGENTIVKPLEGGIYVLGDKNQFLNITVTLLKIPRSIPK